MKLFAFLLFAFLFRFKRLTIILKYIFISEIWNWLTALMKWFKKLIYWLAVIIIIAFLPMKLLEEKRDRERERESLSLKTLLSEVSVHRSSFKQVFLKISQYSRGNTCVEVFFYQVTRLNTPTQAFFCEYYEVFINVFFFAEHPWWLFLLFWLVIEWKYVTTLMFLNIAPVLNETFDHDDFGNNSLNNCRISMFMNCHELAMNCILVY